MLKRKSFQYFGLIIPTNGEIVKDVNYWIREWWTKQRSESSVVCDCRMPIKLKEKFYKIAIEPIMFHHTECWAIKRPSIHKMSVVEM